ncbi:MAG: SsrA-binding protein SmpB [Clostridia bacterium]|nr:SsrA-binding protein SmpB [Clostridia bacterium]
MKIITENRAAYFEYFIEEKYEAGIALDGGEVKSIRQGNVNLKDSFCFVRGYDVWLKNAHIAVYDRAGAYNTKDSKRDRRLLLHKREISKIVGKINERGYTLVPLKLYFKDALIKAELGLCKGKHTYDKKQSLAERDLKRQTAREIKEYYQ